MHIKFCHDSLAIYESLPFRFQNVNGFSSPQPLISKQKKDLHEFIYGNGVMMHMKIGRFT